MSLLQSLHISGFLILLADFAPTTHLYGPGSRVVAEWEAVDHHSWCLNTHTVVID